MDAVHLGSDRDARCGRRGIAFYGPYVVVDTRPVEANQMQSSARPWSAPYA